MTGVYGTVGTAAATIRLQRLTDNVRRRRNAKLIRYSAACLLPLLCAAAVGYAAIQQPPKDVGPLLRPDQVEKAETVEQQFLVAVQRNDEAGWRAVSSYFPAKENPDYAAYHLKSLLHLADVQLSEGRLQEANLVLDAVLDNPDADKIYQLLAWERKLQVCEQQSDAMQTRKTKNKLTVLYKELEKNNPIAVRRFESVVRPERLAELSLGANDT